MIDRDQFSKTPIDIASLLGTVDTYIRWNNTQGPQRRYDIYHPSAFGKCLRQMQYKRYASEGIIDSTQEEFESRLLRLFEKGHNMQSRWERYFEKMGVLRGVWTCVNQMCRHFDDDGNYSSDEPKDSRPRIYGHKDLLGAFKPEKCACGSSRFDYNEVSVRSDDLNMYGHADLILDFKDFKEDKYDVVKSFNMDQLPKKPIVVDMKTINSNGFDNLTTYKKAPPLYYQVQLIIYIHLLDCEYGVLFYENKNDSTLKAYKVERDEKSWELIQKQAKLMQDMATVTGEDDKRLFLLPPPRPVKKSTWDCKSCGFRKMCYKSKIWKDPELENKRKKFYGHLLK